MKNLIKEVKDRQVLSSPEAKQIVRERAFAKANKIFDRGIKKLIK